MPVPILNMDNSWRTSLAHNSRQRLVKRIMDTLQRHMPVAGQDGAEELLKIARRFEEKIFQAATDQQDYLRKISLKMLSLETKAKRYQAAEQLSFLKLTEECLEAMEKMPSPKFNNEQCDYLVEKLKRVVQCASLFLELPRAEVHRPSHVDIARSNETFKLLLVLANQIKSFVHGCCKDAWIQAAMTLTNVAEYVSSIGSEVELCRLAFSKECETTESLTLDQVVDINNAQVEIVKKKATADVETLLAKVTLELNSLSGENRDLASYLLQRLLRVQANRASFTLGSSLWDINDESFWGRLFKWVKPAERLGKGASATVHKATWLGIQVAKKTFQGHENPDFKKEVGILGKLCHPNITSMFCCAKDKRWCAIIMELMDEDLHDLIQRRCDGDGHTSPFPILEAVDIMLQIAKGVSYLHTQKIVHRDLKSFNILVKSVKASGSEIEYVHAKVADFGLSKTKESSIRYSNQTYNTGTNRWMAPEIINMKVGFGDQGRTLEPKYPFKCDVYSFSMLCYEILTGNEPFFEESSPIRLKEKVLKGERPNLPDQCPPLLKALIKQCWIQEPKERPSFAFICVELKYLKHLLMTGFNAIPPTSGLAQPTGTKSIDGVREPQQAPEPLSHTKLWEVEEVPRTSGEGISGQSVKSTAIRLLKNIMDFEDQFGQDIDGTTLRNFIMKLENEESRLTDNEELVCTSKSSPPVDSGISEEKRKDEFVSLEDVELAWNDMEFDFISMDGTPQKISRSNSGRRMVNS